MLVESVIQEVGEKMKVEDVSPNLTKGMLAFEGEQTLTSIKFNYKLAQLIEKTS